MLASNGLRIFTTPQAREYASSVGLSGSYLPEALHYLASSGWIIRLRRGLYALSPTVPGITPAHEFEIAMALANPAAISHWSALQHHGLTEQVPRKVFVLTTLESRVPRADGPRAEAVGGGHRIGDAVYQFIQVVPQRFFGTEEVWVDDARVTITNTERTLLDGLCRPRYCGDFGEVLHAFDVLGDRLDVERIVAYALKIDAATVKRLGWVLEKQGVGCARLERLARFPVKGYRTLDPTGPRKGPCNRRWMIQENLPGRIRT